MCEPNQVGRTLAPGMIVDVGANIEPKPHHLAQYGVMGAIYAEHILGIESPRVALMNVGGEEQKGDGEAAPAGGG